MDRRRQVVRLSIHDIPESLKNPQLFFNNETAELEIENLSPLGIGFAVAKSVLIMKGDFFYLKYISLHSDFKCLCVFVDEDGESRHIGAYFADPEDQKIMLNYLL